MHSKFKYFLQFNLKHYLLKQLLSLSFFRFQSFKWCVTVFRKCLSCAIYFCFWLYIIHCMFVMLQSWPFLLVLFFYLSVYICVQYAFFSYDISYKMTSSSLYCHGHFPFFFISLRTFSYATLSVQLFLSILLQHHSFNASRFLRFSTPKV